MQVTDQLRRRTQAYAVQLKPVGASEPAGLGSSPDVLVVANQYERMCREVDVVGGRRAFALARAVFSNSSQYPRASSLGSVYRRDLNPR